jgi:transcriptional regulator with XRE-family HTH domain
MAFHARLKELREAAGLTQGSLAELAGMSKGGVANLEQGIRKPSLETAQKLAAALGISCEAFNEVAESEEPRGRGRPRKGEGEPASDAGKPTAEKKRGSMKRGGA